MEKDIYRSQFRLPGDLYEQLKKAAEESGRSVNAELVYRLQTTFIAPSKESEAHARAGLDLAKLTEVDPRAVNWAHHLSAAQNRPELETILTVLMKMLQQTGQLE
jgi:hypothetical protein